MAEVFAGFVAGYSLALVSTPLLSLLLLRLRTGSEVLARLLPAGVNPVGVSVLLHGALAMFFTGVGLVLGLLLLAMRDEAGAAGSRNAPFTLLVASLVLAFSAPFVAFAGPLRPYILGFALLTLAVFGWLMPYLADWSRFD